MSRYVIGQQLTVTKRRGRDVYEPGTSWSYVILERGALEVTTHEKGSRGYTITIYAPNEWRVCKREPVFGET